MGIGSPFNKSTSKKKSRFENTKYFNRGKPGTTGAGMSTFSRPTTRPDSPEGGGTPSTTIVPPPSPQVNLSRGTRYFKTATPPAPPVTITNTGGVGKVNPPAPVPTNPWATFGAQFDPSVNPAAWYAPTEGLRTSLQQSRHGYANADRQLWQDFVNTVTTGYRGDMHERRVQRMMQTPDGWLELSRQYMEAKGFYTPSTDTGGTTTTDTDYSIYMIPSADARKQLLADEKYRTGYLERLNQVMGSQLNMDRFMSMLNSTNPMVIQMFEDMHERLRSTLSTGGTRPPTGGVGG